MSEEKVEWAFERTVTVVEKYNIYGVISNYLHYNNQFRNTQKSLQKKLVNSCQLCDKLFEENEYMTLALNNGTSKGNLFICNSCRDLAIENGVSCNHNENEWSEKNE